MKKSGLHLAVLLVSLGFLFGCSGSGKKLNAPQWEEVSITFLASNAYDNPYTDVDLHVEFIHSDGTKLVRPAFWNGENQWQVRFASTLAEGEWKYTSINSDVSDTGLHDQKGRLQCLPFSGNNPLLKKGLLRMSPGRRTVVHANGHPFLLVGDTPWALPFRGTVETVSQYAKDRQEKGFTAALLMSLQPDKGATGPRDRTSFDGFDVAFEDLPDGHINQMNVSYFQYLDQLVNILIDHGIVPVYQPVFHGFGWKGMDLLGWNMEPAEYARYCRYLVARYGAKPAIYLVGGDGNGKNPGVKEGGEEIERWDAYQQPTGIHYNPFDDWCPEEWIAAGNTSTCYHENKSFQAESWLDFQWCQTGHDGLHLTHKVEKMYDNQPVKAVANGEPTYEAMNNPERAAGWWQGHEAWLQFTSGGTMGHVYGAAGLWQWKLFADEYWPSWADGKGISWKEALALEGSKYVGFFGQILNGFDITDIEKRPDLSNSELLLANPGKLYICYLPDGGSVTIPGVVQNVSYTWYDPKTGRRENPLLTLGETFITPDDNPWVLVIGEKKFN